VLVIFINQFSSIHYEVFLTTQTEIAYGVAKDDDGLYENADTFLIHFRFRFIKVTQLFVILKE
jgi:hypothetical protein